MNYRKFGNTDLRISEVGFGAWGIGGPTMVGDIPIGWGDIKDEQSIAGIKTPEQAEANVSGIVQLEEKDLDFLRKLFHDQFDKLVRRRK